MKADEVTDNDVGHEFEFSDGNSGVYLGRSPDRVLRFLDDEFYFTLTEDRFDELTPEIVD